MYINYTRTAFQEDEAIKNKETNKKENKNSKELLTHLNYTTTIFRGKKLVVLMQFYMIQTTYGTWEDNVKNSKLIHVIWRNLTQIY